MTNRKKRGLERPYYHTGQQDFKKTIARTKGRNSPQDLDFHTSGRIIKGYKHQVGFKERFRLYFVHEGSKVAFLVVYYLISLYIGVSRYLKYATEPKYATTRIIFKGALPFARAGAGLLLFNCAIILFPVCRTLISKLRGSLLGIVVPFDKNITFHKFIGVHILLYTVLHVGAHTFDFLYLSQLGSLGLGFNDMGSPEYLWVSLLPAYTGHIAVFCLFLMVTSSIRPIRQANFEIFWYTHHLFIVFFFALIIHGGRCIVDSLVETECIAFTEFWKWAILSVVCYACERIVLRALIRTRRPVKVQKIIVHPSNVVEIQWIPRYTRQLLTAKPGQYIFLNCPFVGGRQFHPFTLTSCPEEGHMSVHFREAGDFTKRFSKLLIEAQGDSKNAMDMNILPEIFIDGAFGAAAEDAFNFKSVMFVGAGIGVTPFASLLKSIFYQVEMGTSTVERVQFFWICRDTTAFEWFNDLLHTLEQQSGKVKLEYHIYLSKVRPSIINKVMLEDVSNGFDPITGLASKTNYGRPNWDSIFAQTAVTSPRTKVGLFVCGPKPLTKVLKKNCLLYTGYQNTETIFHFNKENFG